MPRLLIFAACEKVITATEDNTGSIISILQGFDLPAPLPEGQPVMAPVTWYVFTLWESQNEEPGRFTQHIQLIAPDGTVMLAAVVPVVTANDGDKRFHRAALRRQGFLLRGIGDYVLRISLKDGDGDFVEMRDRDFNIPVTVRVPQAPAP